jgi:hypothetical protein
MLWKKKKIRGLLILVSCLLILLFSNGVNPAAASYKETTKTWGIPNPIGVHGILVLSYSASNAHISYTGLEFTNYDTGDYYPSVRIINGIETRLKITCTDNNFNTIDTGYILHDFVHVLRGGYGTRDYTEYHAHNNRYLTWGHEYYGVDGVQGIDIPAGHSVTIKAWMRVKGWINHPYIPFCIYQFGWLYPEEHPEDYYYIAPIYRILTISPPNKPTISGPSDGYKNQLLTFGFKTTDPEGDSVSYQINWGDSSTSNLGFSASGAWAYMNHRYIHTGTYYIKVRAKDGDGLWSSWSSGHRIDITASGPF